MARSTFSALFGADALRNDGSLLANYSHMQGFLPKVVTGLGVMFAATNCSSASNDGDTSRATADGGSVVTKTPDGAGSDSDTPNPPHVVGACDKLAAAQTWENITPAQLNPQNWCVPGAPGCATANSTYGTNSFVLDPNNSGTVYLGTASLGLWKTTDCGGSWTHIDTGTEGASLDKGRNWSMVIDPKDSNVLYTVTGYAGPGLYKTIDGGKNWTQLFPADFIAKYNIPGQGVEKVAMSPTNHLHLTTTFHNPCANNPVGGGDWGCMGETLDGGMTWTMTNSGAEWGEGDGQTMIDDKVWFYSNGINIFRTENAGANWTNVKDDFGYNTDGCIFVAPDGKYYSGGGRGIVSSVDGIHWVGVSNPPTMGGPNGGCSITSDGKKLYVSMGLVAYDAPGSSDWFAASDLTDLKTWNGINNPKVVTGGGWLAYDPDHHLLYSSNSTAGFFRVVVP